MEYYFCSSHLGTRALAGVGLSLDPKGKEKGSWSHLSADLSSYRARRCCTIISSASCRSDERLKHKLLALVRERDRQAAETHWPSASFIPFLI